MAESLDHFLPGIVSTDTHKRFQTYQEMIDYLNEPACVIQCDDLDQVVDGLAQWMNSSNHKIALNGLEVTTIIVKRLKEGFKPFVTSVLPATIDRIGDSKDPVRDAAIELTVKLAHAASPQYVFDRMMGAFTHKLWRVREGVMLCLQSSLNIHGAKSLTLSKIVPCICKLLDDQNSQVRETAINTLVDIYCHVGERVRSDIGKKGVSTTKLSAIFVKFDEARDAGRVVAVVETATRSEDARPATAKRPSATCLTGPPAAGTGTAGTAIGTSATSGTNGTASGIARARPASFKSSSSAGAGGVDEDSFLVSFTDVPKVNFFSARELTDLVNKIKDTLSDDKIDWEKRVESLKMTRSLIINGATGYDDFLLLLRQLEPCFQLSVKDLRSQIVREACVSIAYLSQQLGNKFEHFGESVLPPLIALIPNTVKVMATSGIVCIQILIQNTHSQRFVPVITGNIGSKSATIRKYCYEFLEQMLHTWPTHALERHIAVLQDAIKRGLNDADADARVRSRKAYWGFASHFREQADSLLSSLDSSKQRLLQGELSNSSSNNSLNSVAIGAAGSATRVASAPAKPRGRSASTDRGTTAISGLTKRRPQTSATLGPSRVAKTPQKPGASGASDYPCTPKSIIRSSSDLDLTAPKRPYLSKIGRIATNTPYRSLPRDKTNGESTPGTVVGSGAALTDSRGRTRSRIGVSQSQPSSRSNSPSSRLSYLTYQKPVTDARAYATTSRIPRSQGTSRETSPNRTSRQKAGTPQRVPQGVLAQNILTKNTEAEQALANALMTTASRSRYDTYDSDDAMSETSSICSDRSFGSYGGRTSEEEYSDTYRPHRQRRKIPRIRRCSRDNLDALKGVSQEDVTLVISEDVGGILSNLGSGSWADRKEGLVQLQQLMQTTRVLNKLEVKKVTEIFTRMFHEPHNKVFCVYMETLLEFIYIYKDAIGDWLHVLLTRLLTKLGAELLGSVTMKIQRALDAVRDNFQYDHQFGILTKFIIDSTQTPTNKIAVRAGILNYMHALIRMMDPSDLVINTDTKLAVTRIITWTSEPKSVDVRKSSCAVIIALFDLNSPEFSAILAEIPKSFQETATRILHNHLKNNSTESEVLMPRNTTPGSGQTPRSKSTQRGPRDQYETENMNPEEIYNSICQTSADIQNLSLNSKLDQHYDDIKLAKERDSTSQDSGIQNSIPDLRDGHHGNQHGHHQYQLHHQQQQQQHHAYHSDVQHDSNGGRDVGALRELHYNPSHYQDGHGDVNGMEMSRTAGLAEAAYEYEPNEDYPYDVNDPLADVLAELSNHSQRTKERSAAMTKLKRVITDTDTDYTTLWDEHFKNVLFVLLEMLADEDADFRVRAMNRLQDLIVYHASRLDNYVELVILRVMEAHRDPERRVQIAAEACAPALGSVIQSEQSLKCLQDFIRPGEFPANYTAIKIQNKAVEHMDEELLVRMLPEIVPELIKGCDHEETFVRKASVFCLVGVYMVAGEQLTPHLQELRGSKLKLLNLYITREQKKRAAKTGSIDDNTPIKMPLSPTSSEGTLLS